MKSEHTTGSLQMGMDAWESSKEPVAEDGAQITLDTLRLFPSL